MSTLELYNDECGGYHEYTGGCSVHWGVHESTGGTMSTLGDVQYTKEIP